MSWVTVPNKDGTTTLIHSDLYDNYLAHYGIKRKSGRYPWGSGKEPYQSLASSRRQYQKTLNKLDKKKGKTMADYMRTDLAVNEGIKRTDKAHAKYSSKPSKRNKKRFDKSSDRLDKDFAKRDNLGYKIDDYKSSIKKTAKDAKSSGYEVSSKPVKRNYDKVTTGLLTGLGTPMSAQIYNQNLYGNRFDGQYPSSVRGNKWKVTKKKKSNK